MTEKNYFENSQSVKNEMERRPDLLQITRDCFAERIKEFSFGSTVNLYRVGRLESGVYVALRRFRHEGIEGHFDLIIKMRYFDMYCQNAEELYSRGESVPEFCVGVTFGNDAGILTEDLTSNGEVEFEHHPDHNFGFVIKGDIKKRVLVDIDYLYGSIHVNSDRNTKYFANDARINLQ